MGNEIQEPIPGLLGIPENGIKSVDSVDPVHPTSTPIPQEKRDTENRNYPSSTNYGRNNVEEEADEKILDRNDPSVRNFIEEARRQLYNHLLEKAKENGNERSFLERVGSYENSFISITPSLPSYNKDQEEEKMKDPYYSYPKQYKKGLSTFTTEHVNSGNGWLWEVTKKEISGMGGSPTINWLFSNIQNSKY